ncbi:MAG: Lytic transglycosylase, catalytic, partial [Bryobacterales bacterium]|nr:Lytic transglycosylase, catalytic [Bryobacterales bacterium]
QQAEEKFRAGRKFYQDKDFDHARAEFDASIDLMLRASESPTDRALYECKLDDLIDGIHRLDLAGMGAAAVQTQPQFEKAPNEDIVQMTFPVDPRIKTRVQSEVPKLASELPLMVNDTVLGYINYFNGRGHRTIEYGLARAGKYRPMISRVLAEEGVPQELIHLAQAESGFIPRAISSAAAGGMWQFMKFRGNEYGLHQSALTDDRFDPEKATRAAAKHLHDLYNQFGDWYLAIAAYNCGPGCVERAIERTGYADYWELRARKAIPAETTNYVPIILAMAIMAKSPAEYGIDNITLDPAQEYDIVPLGANTNLPLVSDLIDTPIPELQQLNPSLLKSLAPAGFELKVPKGAGLSLTAALDGISAERRAAWRMHRVQQGETLATIAQKYSSQSRTIASANELNEADLAPGAQLLIPAVYREPVPVRVAVRATAKKTVARRTIAPRKQTVAVASTKHTAPKSAGTLAQVRSTRALAR